MPRSGAAGLVALAAALAGCADAAAPERASHPAAIEFSGAALRAHTAVLAHDSMCGRGAGSPYERMAADYVERSFVASGLGPGGLDGYGQTVLIGPIPLPRDPVTPGPRDPTVATTSRNVLGVLAGGGALAG